MANTTEKTEKTEAEKHTDGTGAVEVQTIRPAADGSIGEGLSNFVQRNRKTLGILLVAVVAALVFMTAGLIFRDALRGQALKEVEELQRRYTELLPDIKNQALETDLDALLVDLGAFAGQNSGYAAARAHSLRGGLFAERGDWEQAEESWRAAAKAGAKTYLAPVSLCNAAAAAEERGNPAVAIELYTQSLSFPGGFPAAPRAQFSIGRLLEAEGNFSAALEAYNEVLGRWPDDPVWPNLAQSRIIRLGIEGR